MNTFGEWRKFGHPSFFANKKVTYHNMFAIPVIIPTFGITNWKKEELSNTDIKTQKLLTSTGSFHINSDVDRLYSYRNKGGRGVNSLVNIYISRLVFINSHLIENHLLIHTQNLYSTTKMNHL